MSRRPFHNSTQPGPWAAGVITSLALVAAARGQVTPREPPSFARAAHEAPAPVVPEATSNAAGPLAPEPSRLSPPQYAPEGAPSELARSPFDQALRQTEPGAEWLGMEPPAGAPVWASEPAMVDAGFDTRVDNGPYNHPAAYGGYAPADETWRWFVLPNQLIYKSYLAGVKESRLSGGVLYVDESVHEKNTMWDATLGGRVGMLRYGSPNPNSRDENGFVRGVQLDCEGSAQLRLDIFEDVDVQAVDFRAGVPLTIGWNDLHGSRLAHQTKFAYYHLSSHLGDEFLLKQPTFQRLNYARDVLVLGHSVYLLPELRVYGEVGYAFYNVVSKPWEVQFGAEWAPACPTGWRGAPFMAINGHLREEVDYSGNLTFQAGWAWRGDEDDRLFRVGLHYFNGLSNHYSFHAFHEQQIGFGAWYDF